MKQSIPSLITTEGWEIKNDKVIVYGKEFSLVHPCLIHLSLYKNETNPEIKYLHMKAAHDYLWPHYIDTFHSWTKERFQEHCNGYSYIGWAGGSSTGKSLDAAKVALLFWFASPKRRGVIIASTSMQALESRVWGYAVSLLNSRKIDIPVQYMSGNSPKILFPADKSKGEIKDSVHGIFAVAARQGSDESVINTWIGRHPEDALMLVLDECTDLNVAISKSFVNLDSSEKPFQCLGLGNSNSWFDLHGMLCYPKDGIESINPDIHKKWETTQKNGIALFFDCYDSPAIHETDPKKKKLLSKFLVTEEQLKEKELQYGRDSDQFARFVRGYWKNVTADKTMVSKPFLEAHKVDSKPEYLDLQGMQMVAGLDPAFSSGGDACILRLGMLCSTVDGKVVLDFKGEKLLFKLLISAKINKAIEIQIADQVIEILGRYNLSTKILCVDANGQGRALGGTIQLRANSLVGPTKVYSVRSGDTNQRSFDIKIIEAYDLWSTLRTFIENDQIRGMDRTTMYQLTNRMIVTTDDNGKPIKPRLENKTRYKRRMSGIMPSLGHSPDEADAAALCLQSAIIHYGFRVNQRREILSPSVSFADAKLNAFKAELAQKKEKENQLAIGSGFGNAITDFRSIPFKLQS